MHWVAIARAAGVIVNWDDFDQLSQITPLLARVYPNGSADVNDMHHAGGTAFIIRELLDAGLMHGDVHTVTGTTLYDFAKHEGGSRNEAVLRPVANPFAADGGIRVIAGNLGRSVVKVAAVAKDQRCITAPAAVFDSQEAVQAAFKAGSLNRDCIVVVRGQGPKACGMPELHKLTPPLSVLQDQGFKVALVTDGRMSGASGKVPAAIHMTPEAYEGGPLAKLRDGDMLELNCETGTLNYVGDSAAFHARANSPLQPHVEGWGRELFGAFRKTVGGAEEGACVLF
jgi:phosphogluconate dehydratase